ncbi:DUF1493 family protein [Vandammella animalimorsus]|uniref:DUF1493 family protein n=1 Tax=Vandammella animalimorsus TaxID=2029117 RepID=A0A3M6R196_9BURK|nr:DUF1493 family protein [Vandammella animalimorsus]RMX09027.1 DUF1493 family protein [Vandammella animalimorsus]
MSNELSVELREYLKRCGVPENKIMQCNGMTRMYHDLGIYGDIAEACMEVLAEHYRVDLSNFDFGKFFPHEFGGKNMLARALLWIVPFAGSTARRCGEWLPLTLERIDRAIHNKRWE